MNQSQREFIQQKYKNSRSNLLLVVILTVLNLVLFFTGSETMMLFSASIPYYAVVFGAVLQIDELAIAGLCIAAVVIVLYFLCWLLSKKHYGWLIVALVMFVLDTLTMAGLYLWVQDFSGILDALIHVWILYYLIVGVINGRKLKLLPPEPEAAEIPEAQEEETACSTPLRRAAEDVKFRVLLESTHNGHTICYRRVKRVNELVIDRYVYAEVEMLMETAHILSAKVDGHTYEVGFDGAAHSYFNVDGNTVAKKLRLY